MSRSISLSVALTFCALSAPAAAPTPEQALRKIHPWVLEHTANGATSSFIVVLAAQADTSGAAALESKEAKGRYVYELLRKTAEASQGPVKALLDGRKVPYRAFWIANMITVESGDASLVMELAGRGDVGFVEGNPTIHNKFPAPEQQAASDARLQQTLRSLASPDAPDTTAWGISNTNAPAVWTAGFNGSGIVIGGEDTGVTWDHTELKGKYRGWNGATANHDYNWHDSVHSGGNSGNCAGANRTVPCDDGGGGSIYHGTHTMGTMVGGDGPGASPNDVGMAYGAKWIGCRNMDRGNGTPTLYIECHQWMLAPTTIAGTNPDPSKAPHVINNSWGCPVSEGCPVGSNILLNSIKALVNAGIVYEASNGNDGPGCGSVDLGSQAGPPAFYAKPWVFSTGALNSSNTLADFSSLGPVTADGSNRIKPDISAPGVSVNSTWCCANNYQSISGTSMAGPHTVGAVALLLSARPAIAGQVERVIYALEQKAVHDVANGGQPSTCGSTAFGAYPSNFYGWGRLNIQAAVNSVCTAAQLATPAAPALAPSCGSVSLSWPAVSGATDYEVWRADASASCRPMYQVASTTGGATTYNNTGLTSVTQYSYYILAKNATCATVAGGCATTTTTAATPTPMSVNRGSKASTNVVQTWTAVAGATSYSVYRNTANNPAIWGAALASGLTGLTWTDNNQLSNTTSQFYSVTDINGCGSESPK